MSTLVTSAVISKETLLNFENNLVIGRMADWSYSDKFAKPESQIGNSCTLRKPINVNFAKNNMAWNAAQSVVVENVIKLVVDRTITVPMSFTEGDLALKVERFSERYIKPAARVLASNLDSDIASAVINCAVGALSPTSGLGTNGLDAAALGTASSAGYVVGLYNTTLTPDTVLQARQVLLDQGCPDDGELYGALSTKANRQLVGAQATLFNTLGSVEGEYKKGYIGDYAGIEFSTTQSLANHTNGTQPTLVVSAGNLATGWAEFGTLTVTALAGAIKAGDVFVSPDIYIVNPLTKIITSTPAQFTVVADAIATATTVTVSPAPISGGQYQNISATLNGDTLSLTGASTPGVASQGLSGVESLVFHRKAIAVVSPEFEVPTKGVEMAESIKGDDLEGFKVRFLRVYDALGTSAVAQATPGTGGGVGTAGPAYISRFDGMYGIKVTNPAWIVRIRN